MPLSPLTGRTADSEGPAAGPDRKPTSLRTLLRALSAWGTRRAGRTFSMESTMARGLLIDRRVALRVTARCEAAARRLLIEEGRRQLARVEREANPTGIETFVDGRAGAPLESVRPDGKLHWEFHYVREVAEAALALLRETSPVDTGSYQREHAVYLDGARVSDLTGIETARRIVISNTAEYARVIEIGIGRRVPWSKQPQVPKEGVYRAAERTLRRRFNNVVNARFGWVGLDAENETGSTRSGDRFPALFIERR